MVSREELIEIYSTSVPGLGSTKAEALYDAGFDSLRKLVNATKEELLIVEGIGPAMANKIIESAKTSYEEPASTKVEPAEVISEKPAAEETKPEEKQKDVETTPAKDEAEEPKEETGIRRLFKGRRKGTEEEKKPEKRQLKIAKKERVAERKPHVPIKLTDEENRQMRVRNRQKYRKPEFNKHDSHKKKRVSSSWRKPQGQHNKQRHHFASKGKIVQAGFGAPSMVRGKHPSGFDEVLVYSPEELEQIKPTQAVRIAGTVGLKKRLRIEVTCEKNGIKLLNPSNLIWESEEEEESDSKNKDSREVT